MLARYFAVLRYDFPPAVSGGLCRFYELAHEAGELDEVPEFRFIDEVAGHEAIGRDAANRDGPS